MKNLRKLFVLLILPLLSVSCIVDDENDNGFQSSPYTLGFARSSTLESYFEDVGAVNIDITVNILGGNSGIALPNNVDVNYAVDPSSTATEGNEFTLLGNSFTIESGSSFGFLPLQINTGGLDPDQPTTLVLRLTSASGAAVSSINDTYTITFVGCQSDHAGPYTCAQTIDGGRPNTNIFELAPNTYRIESMPYIAFGGLDGSPAWIDFTNVCGDVNFSGDWVAGTLAEGTGSVDDATGIISFDYLTIYNGSAPSSGIWFDLGPSEYVPQ